MAAGSEHQKLAVRFISQLLDDHSSTFHEILDLVDDTSAQEAYKLLHQHFPRIPEPLLWECAAVATNSFVHAAALRAARTRHDQVVDDELFRHNLVDMFLVATSQKHLGTD
jgi:hypothetical protein